MIGSVMSAAAAKFRDAASAAEDYRRAEERTRTSSGMARVGGDAVDAKKLSAALQSLTGRR